MNEDTKLERSQQDGRGTDEVDWMELNHARTIDHNRSLPRIE